MDIESNGQFGDFALFGFSPKTDDVLQNKLQQLGVQPQIIDFGEAGHFYFYTNYGDVVETKEFIGLKLGFVRTPDISPLSMSDLVKQQLITPQCVNQDGMRGNALVACFSKITPEFSVYQTLFSTPQLYYTNTGHHILCATNQAILVALLDRLELNEEILPFHFLFQLAIGPLTYFRQVDRMFPGQHLHWKAGHLNVRQVKSLEFSNLERFDQINDHTVEIVYERIKAVINAYLDDLERAGYSAANLLSGGVDSSLIQLVINERRGEAPKPLSFSYAVHTPQFGFEVDYAREAGKLLGTNHTIADILPDDYPNMLTRATKIVAQPVPAEPEPCKMKMAHFLAAQANTPRFYFAGQAADAVYGLALARKLAVFDIFQKIPASPFVLNSIAGVMQLRSAKTAGGIREIAATLPVFDDPRSFKSWANAFATYTNLDVIRRSFGDEPLHKALTYRRQLGQQYLNSSDLAERIHVIDLLTDGYEPAMFGSQFFLAHHKEQIYPYLDEDIIRVAFAFAPQIRYLKSKFGFTSHRNTKPLLKEILIKKGLKTITEKRKGASVFDDDLLVMMKSGPLRDMVQAIDRPAFLSKSDFETLLDRPDWFLWNLLTFDTFQKNVLKQGSL